MVPLVPLTENVTCARILLIDDDPWSQIRRSHLQRHPKIRRLETLGSSPTSPPLCRDAAFITVYPLGYFSFKSDVMCGYQDSHACGIKKQNKSKKVLVSL